MPDSTLHNKIREAVRWTVFSRIVAQLISWVTTLIVIRLIAPEDYGVLALATTVYSLLFMLSSSGFGDSIIQSRETSERHIRYMLGFLVILATCLGVVQIISSPFVANYYNEPRVKNVLLILTINLILFPWVNISTSVLKKELDFKYLSKVELISSIIAAVCSLILAYMGSGVWALVVAMQLNMLIKVIALNVKNKKYIVPLFGIKPILPLLRFGGIVSLTTLVWVLYSQVDVIILGRSFSSSEVGIYSVAVYIASLPMGKIMPLINQISFPVYSKINDDIDRINYYLLRVISAISIIIFPIFIGIGMVSEEFSIVVLGEKWSSVGYLLSIVCFAMPFRVLSLLFSPAVRALGRPEITLQNGIINLLIFSAGVLVGSRFGLSGIAICWIVTAPMGMLVIYFNCNQVLKLSLKKVLGSLFPSILSTATMVCVLLLLDISTLLNGLSLLEQLVLKVFIGAISYLGIVLLLYKAEIRNILSVLRTG